MAIDYHHIGITVASHGMSCAIINYRLSPYEAPQNAEDFHLKHPEHTLDCAASLDWLYHNRSKFSYNSDEVYIIGHSAGAFMAGLLIFDKQFQSLWTNGNGLKLKGVIGLQGLYDLPSILKDFPDYLKWVVLPAFGRDETIYQKSSPTFLLEYLASMDTKFEPSDIEMTPWTIVWSDRDELVNKRQGDEFEKALEKLHVPVKQLVLSEPETSAEFASHHGITTKMGFNKLVLPILLSIMKK